MSSSKFEIMKRWWLDTQDHHFFTPLAIVISTVLVSAHYTLGEWVVHPNIQLWKERAFWSDLEKLLPLPVLHWAAWRVISRGKIKPAPIILVSSIFVSVGDLFCFSLTKNLATFGVKVSGDLWEQWSSWVPMAILIVNFLLLKRWLSSLVPPEVKQQRPQTKSMVTPVVRIFVTGAIGSLALIYWIIPQLPANAITLFLAKASLIHSDSRSDFDYLVETTNCRGKPIAAILDHVKLARLQKKQFYSDIEESMYQQFILSPKIDWLPLSELNWRRVLWKNLRPHIGQQKDPMAVAKIVGRILQEHIGIDPAYHYRVGVETIWIQRATDETGYKRLYVAALRTVGVASRLEHDEPELWTGESWIAAPKPLVLTW